MHYPMIGLRGPSAKGGRAAGDQPREAGKEKKKSAAGEIIRERKIGLRAVVVK